ncbi:LysR family transcriptional regulator [Paraburkholderia xenovorans]|uniref:LysR family transcriptional regulator n=1 Tax=Paraburkholderia xenovorans TaxID=36873 RepID=UPI0038BC525B
MDFHKLPDIDLKLLVIFDEIRKCHSLTLAAENLGVTQSAISKSLQRLRRHLGDTLFVRSPNGMEATPRAKALEAPIADVLRTYYERIAIAPSFDPASSDRIFAIHASDLGMSVLLPILIPELKRRAPHARITGTTGNQHEVLEGLEVGDIDLSLGAFSSLSESGIYQQRLFVEQYICLVRRGHPVCAAPVFDTDLFQQQTHIIVASGKSGHIHGRAETLLLDEILPSNVAVRVPSFLLAAMLTRHTDHVLTVPSAAAIALAPEFDLECLPCPLKLPEFTVLQYWHERFSHDPACQWLRTFVHGVFDIPDSVLERIKSRRDFPPLSCSSGLAAQPSAIPIDGKPSDLNDGWEHNCSV